MSIQINHFILEFMSKLLISKRETCSWRQLVGFDVMDTWTTSTCNPVRNDGIVERYNRLLLLLLTGHTMLRVNWIDGITVKFNNTRSVTQEV